MATNAKTDIIPHLDGSTLFESETIYNTKMEEYLFSLILKNDQQKAKVTFSKKCVWISVCSQSYMKRQMRRLVLCLYSDVSAIGTLNQYLDRLPLD